MHGPAASRIDVPLEVVDHGTDRLLRAGRIPPRREQRFVPSGFEQHRDSPSQKCTGRAVAIALL
jgi:hypothetical protein